MDLKTNNSSDVFKYVADDYVIIEWSNMLTYDNSSQETFQIILYDNTYLTPTGDNEIKIQYKEFNNTSGYNYNHPVYSTVGIESHMGDLGLEYTYNNQYPQAANALFDQSALFITTRSDLSIAEPSLDLNVTYATSPLGAKNSTNSTSSLSILSLYPNSVPLLND